MSSYLSVSRQNSKKRSRSDDIDEVEGATTYQRNGWHKFPRKAACHTAAPDLTRAHDVLLATARELGVNPDVRREVMSPVLEEVEHSDDNQVDEKSVESILNEALPSSPEKPDVQPNGNLFWPRNGLAFPLAHVDIEDEAGEKHRRFSCDAKGKGRATRDSN